MHAAIQQSLTTITQTTGLDFPGTPLVVAVSGGPDSLSLLHALRQFVPDHELTVAHFDHQLRLESADDAAFVRALAEEWGLAYQGGMDDVAQLAADSQVGLEEAGRLARYRFLTETAYTIGAPAIVTGHHADDQVETVLMHILRGSGLAGLRGMLPATPLPADPDLWLLRPLLQTGRAEIVQYIRDHNLRPLEDETNSDPTYFRNRLRHELIPLLRTYNPQVDERLLHLSQVVSADQELIESVTASTTEELIQDYGTGWVFLHREDWATLPLSLRRSTLRFVLHLLLPDQRDFGFIALEAARRAAEAPRSGQSISLPGGAVLQITGESLLISIGGAFPTDLAPQLLETQPIRLPIGGKVRLNNGRILTAERVNRYGMVRIESNRDAWTAFVDLKPNASLVVRGRLPGERMQPLGLGGHSRTLQDIMIDRKIPAPLRANWPVVAVADHAVWLTGQVIDHRCRVTESTAEIIRLACI